MVPEGSPDRFWNDASGVHSDLSDPGTEKLEHLAMDDLAIINRLDLLDLEICQGPVTGVANSQGGSGLVT